MRVKKNMGNLDRAIRAVLVAPAAIVAASLLGPTSAVSIVLWVLAGLMLVTAATGFCVLYVPLGIDTLPPDDRPVKALPTLTLTRVWWAMVFVWLGGLGVLHVLGVLDWSRSVGGWWPVAIVGWGAAEMFAARRFSLSAAIVTIVGLGLLADEQRWTGRGFIWSALFVAIGAAILFGGRRHKKAAKKARKDATHNSRDTALAGPPPAR